MEAARTLKANLKLDGKPCGWCQVALRLGDDAAVCRACENEHHGGCWESNAGCSTAGCVNAPLRRLDVGSPGAGSPIAQGLVEQGAAEALPPGYMACPKCRVAISNDFQICPACRAITSPDGLYHGPKTNAPGAVSSLVIGLIGLSLALFIGIGSAILGVVTIARANKARRAIPTDPTLGGGGLATAGLVLGIVNLIIWVLIVVTRINGMGER